MNFKTLNINIIRKSFLLIIIFLSLVALNQVQATLEQDYQDQLQNNWIDVFDDFDMNNRQTYTMAKTFKSWHNLRQCSDGLLTPDLRCEINQFHELKNRFHDLYCLHHRFRNGRYAQYTKSLMKPSIIRFDRQFNYAIVIKDCHTHALHEELPKENSQALKYMMWLEKQGQQSCAHWKIMCFQNLLHSPESVTLDIGVWPIQMIAVYDHTETGSTDDNTEISPYEMPLVLSGQLHVIKKMVIAGRRYSTDGCSAWEDTYSLKRSSQTVS